MRPLHELLIEAATRKSLPQASRRGVLALAAAAPAAFGLESVLAQVDAEDRKKKRKRDRKRDQKKNRRDKRRDRGADNQGDIDILNYALTLEHLEYAFYRDGLDPVGPLDDGDFGMGVFALLSEIRAHELAHVNELIDVIISLGGTPVQAACYDFDYDMNSAAAFLARARDLEDVGVSAYDGAIAGIVDPDLQTAGATIATVEARHASYLRFLNDQSPFPNAFDPTRTMQEVLAIAGPFIVECP